jgi:hypothetical protein
MAKCKIFMSGGTKTHSILFPYFHFMHRIHLLLFFLLFLVQSQFAQVSIGAKAGINLCSWNTNGSNTLTSFHGGGLAQFELSDRFNASVELLYNGKGTDLDDFIPNNPMKFTTQYISMPVMFGYNVGHVTFKAGVETSKLLSSSVEINSQEQDVPEAFEDWDYGILGGATLQIVSGLSLEIRYIYGMKDVVDLLFVDENGQFLARLDKGKNRVLQFGLRYQFEL